MIKTALSVYDAIRGSLGLEDDVDINDFTRLGDLSNRVDYCDLLDIFHRIGGNHLKLKQYFNADKITSDGVKLLEGLAADLLDNPRDYFMNFSGKNPGDYIGNLRPLEIQYIKSRLTK